MSAKAAGSAPERFRRRRVPCSVGFRSVRGYQVRLGLVPRRRPDNAKAFKSAGEGFLIEAATKGPLPHTVVVDFEEVFLIDDTGEALVTGLFEQNQRYGVDLALGRVHAGTHKILHLTSVDR